MEKNVDILVLGAGVTGLSVGSFLGDRDFLILEKGNEVGGYCKTTIKNGFVWDYSGHFFHFKNQEIKDYVLENLDCRIFTVEKKSHIYYKDRVIDFPFQNNIHQLEIDEFIECLFDLSSSGDDNPVSFKDYIVQGLGKSICDKFIIPYNEKLYGINLDDLDYDSMGRFFPKMESLESLLHLLKNRSKTSSYNDTFIYPEFGCFEFIKSIKKRVDGSKILTGVKVLSIDLEEKKVETTGGIFRFNKLISTLPFNYLLESSGQPQNLSSNRVAVFNLGFDKPTKIESNWIYFPGDEIFYRVGFYNNIFDSSRMSLYVEIGLSQDEIIDEEKTLRKVMEDLRRRGIVQDQNLIESQFILMSPAYCHITKESKKFYSDWCEKWNKEGIYSIGRYGQWTYCSIEDNIIEAKELVKTI